MKTKTYQISKERATKIAADHNRVSLEITNKYTNIELQEVLRQLGIKAVIK